MATRTEAQMMENWQHLETPVVSIICITYNHRLYITDAIESFLKQQTDFPFEIIIHDDASTDGTAEIVQRYAEKYPSIIKLILQKENQSSQLKKNALLPIIMTAVSHTKGQYIAYCDGDDYWTDEHKLQIQISEMQKHPHCEMSFHPVFRKPINGKRREKIISRHSRHNKIFETKQLVLGAAKFCPTVSFVFNKNVFSDIPQWLFDAACTDYFLQILASLKGGALYISKVMAVYRSRSIGSWTEKVSKDKNLIHSYFSGMLLSLEDINSHTHNQFINELNVIRKKLCFFMSVNPALSLENRKEIFRQNKKLFDLKRKILWYLIFRNKKLSEHIFDIRNYIFH